MDKHIMMEKMGQSHMRFLSIVLLLGVLGMLGGYRLWPRYVVNRPSLKVIQHIQGHFCDMEKMDSVFLLSEKIDGLQQNRIVLYHDNQGENIELWRSPVSSAWQIELADVDGDGICELAVCLYKTEKHDANRNNRLQIYAWGKNGVYAKWRGTFLCRPFKKTRFGDLDHDNKAELVSVEQWKNQQYVCVYKWNGFGFDLAAQQVFSGKHVKGMRISDNQGDTFISLHQADKKLFFQWKNGRLLNGEG